MTDLYFERLTKDRIVQAFPLMRELHPDLTVDRWVHAAAELVGEGAGRGIIAALRNGYIRCLFTYRLDRGADDRPQLVIEDLVVMDMLPGNTLVPRLVDTIRDLADRLAAPHVRIHLVGSGDTLAQAFDDAGFDVRLETAANLHIN